MEGIPAIHDTLAGGWDYFASQTSQIGLQYYLNVFNKRYYQWEEMTMPRQPMTPEQTEAVRRRILKEAALIVAEEGIGALSMRYVASKMGMTGGALYRYFPSRQDLILAHFSIGMSDLHERLMAGETSPDPLTALRDYALSYADFALSDPIRFRLMFLEDNKATENAGVNFETVAAVYGEFVRRMAAAMDARALAPGEPKPSTDVLWAGLHGSVTLAIVSPEMDLGDPREFIERTIDTILKGLSQGERRHEHS
ncbi:TetR/AcrR family transcriptional regulator [Pseudochelatococcus lubricantis]|uniref:TetR/AcrR family transcriptional regulator n=1 Tax=Pseudochelatococcus lubricantis TaxID=1538102 RepID=UPI0035E79CEE